MEDAVATCVVFASLDEMGCQIPLPGVLGGAGCQRSLAANGDFHSSLPGRSARAEFSLALLSDRMDLPRIGRNFVGWALPALPSSLCT